MKKTQHKKLLAMVEALIADDAEAAATAYHEYSVSKTRSLVLGEEKDEEEDEDEDEDEDADDEAEKEAEKDEDEAIDKLKKAQKKEKKAEKMEEMDMSHAKDVKNRDHGETYRATPHKDNSRGYGYDKVKKAARAGLKDVKGSKESGATVKKGDAYKDTPHKDNSRGYGYDKVKKAARAGLKGISEALSAGDISVLDETLLDEIYTIVLEKKPSAGMTKKEKSAVVKKAKHGEDIGKPGKKFKEVAAKAARRYGSKEAGERVAAAAMWKSAAK